MKKTVCVVLIALLCLLTACAHTVQPFSTDMGRAVWLANSEPHLPSVRDTVTLPKDTQWVADWGDGNYKVQQDSDGVALYGVWSQDKGWLLPCRNVSLVRSGVYWMGAYYVDERLCYEVYNTAGEMLVGTKKDARLQALSDEYFVLYAGGKVQLFDSQANTYFGDNMFDGSFTFAQCGDYILSYRSADYSYRVWQPAMSTAGGMVMQLKTFADAGVRYTVIYTGGKFLASALAEGDRNHYDYIDYIEGETRYMLHTATWYNPETGETSSTDLGYVILGARGRYIPGIEESDADMLGLADGYTVISVATLNSVKFREGARYYVMDSTARLVWAYPAETNPNALVYLGEVGYRTSGLVPAALYALDGNMMWQDGRHDYSGMVWQSDRLVAAYGDMAGMHYGAFDIDGHVVIDFEYDYLSPFFDGVAVGQRESQYYRMDAMGAETLIEDVASDNYWLRFGCYVYLENGLYGLKDLSGLVILEAQYQGFERIARSASGKVYAIGQKQDKTVVVEIA